MARLSLSAIVCTHGRPEDLGRCLEAFARLEDEVEVIVVDSASEPPCRELVEDFANRIPGLRYLREEQPGLSRARNRGVAAAQGDIVAFIDDDAAPRPGWASRVVAAFATEPAIGCVGGACVAAFPDCPRPRWLSDLLLQLAGITRFTESREARSSAEWPFGANLAFRRDTLAQAGQFREELGRSRSLLLSGEESALIETVYANGWKVWLWPSAAVDHAVHADRCTPRYYWRRFWWGGVSRARQPGSARIAARLLAAAPLRLGLYVVTHDRVYLYRVAELAGFFTEWFRRRATVVLGIGLFLLAFAIRVRQQRHGLLFPDAYDYLLMARGIAEHLTPTTVLGPGGDLFVPSADAAAKPLFHALVALAHGLGASWLDAARAVTAIVGGATVSLVGLLAARLSGSRIAGVAAALLLLVSPGAIYWSGFAGPDPLAQALALGAALALAHRRPAVAGVLGGLAAAARPELVLLAVAAAAACALNPIRRSAAARGATAFALTLGAVFVLLRPPLGLPDTRLLLALPAAAVVAIAASALSSRWRVGAALAAVALAAAGSAAGAAPGAAAVWRTDWPLLGLAGAGLAAAALDRERRKAALNLAGAAALLGAVYWLKNPNLERYGSLLLPVFAVLAAVGLYGVRTRYRLPALAAIAGAFALSVAHAPALGNSSADMFSAVAARLPSAPSSEPLVSAAPEAYAFWLPHRAVKMMRPGTRGLIVLDAAQRLYAPRLSAQGRVVARIENQIGFARPDGNLDARSAILVTGRVVQVR